MHLLVIQNVFVSLHVQILREYLQVNEDHLLSNQLYFNNWSANNIRFSIVNLNKNRSLLITLLLTIFHVVPATTEPLIAADNHLGPLLISVRVLCSQSSCHKCFQVTNVVKFVAAKIVFESCKQKTIVLITNLKHFFNVFISLLYMFRATQCSSSGESIVSIHHLVYITLCRWPSGMQVIDLHNRRPPTQSDIYQMMYWYNWFSWWWALGCSKHVEKWNKHIKSASSWLLTRIIEANF